MIKVSNISYAVPGNSDRMILNNISLSVPEGQQVAIMGANGSGKTTFVRCLNGLLSPSRGEVRIDDIATNDRERLQEIRRLVGMVFQNPENQIVSTTVEREIAFGLENLGIRPDEMQRIVRDMLTTFHLQAYRQQPPHLLSGGEIQRLALASVIAMSPKYLVFDESTSFLDPKSRREVLCLLARLCDPSQTTNPITPIWVTQFAEEALFFDRLLVFAQGRVEFDDAPAAVFEHVDVLQDLGIDVPVEYEVIQYLKNGSAGKISLNPSEILPIN